MMLRLLSGQSWVGKRLFLLRNRLLRITLRRLLNSPRTYWTLRWLSPRWVQKAIDPKLATDYCASCLDLAMYSRNKKYFQLHGKHRHPASGVKKIHEVLADL